jgi:hypothetical protein
MLKRLRGMLASQWEWLRRSCGRLGASARSVAKNESWERSEARARFWAEMREGQREANARSKAEG